MNQLHLRVATFLWIFTDSHSLLHLFTLVPSISPFPPLSVVSYVRVGVLRGTCLSATFNMEKARAEQETQLLIDREVKDTE